MNSGNSSLAPSIDGPGQQPVSSTKPKSPRDRGGLSGYLTRTRPQITTEAYDHVVHYRLAATCSDCGARLSVDDPNRRRQQITDLPPVKSMITECQIHTLRCLH
jgi:hypothetical protein